MHLSLSVPEPLRPRVWWWLVAFVVVQWIAWAVWFTIAASHPVAEIPIVAGPGF